MLGKMPPPVIRGRDRYWERVERVAASIATSFTTYHEGEFYLAAEECIHKAREIVDEIERLRAEDRG